VPLAQRVALLQPAMRFAGLLCCLGVAASHAQTQRSSIGSSSSSSSTTSSTQTSTPESITLSGHVVDSVNHQPIQRALVRYGSRAVLTDHDGLFSFPGVTATTGSLTALKPGFYPDPSGQQTASKTYQFMPTAQITTVPEIQLVLYPEAILTGTVSDAAGEGLEGFMVTARRSTYNETGHRWQPSGSARTNADGNFRIPLAPGRYALEARLIGRPRSGGEVFLPVSVPANSSSIKEAIKLSPGEEAKIDLRPEERKAYEVSLGDSGGGGRGMFRLTARTPDGLTMPVNLVPGRGDSGGFQVLLPNGTYTLSGTVQTPEGAQEAETRVTVAGHDVGGVDLHYSQVPQLPVKLYVDPASTSDNVTIPTAMQLGLTLTSTGASDMPDQSFPVTMQRDQSAAFSVPSGSYRLMARATGQWVITSASCGGTDLLANDLEVSSGMGAAPVRITISNQTASLTGTVTIGGQPGNASVYLIATGPSATPVLILRAGSSGTFSRSYLAPGTYHVLAVEHPVEVNLLDPETLGQFSTQLQTVTLAAGGQETLTLEAVPLAELPQ
jgi:hypothetical protein